MNKNKIAMAVIGGVAAALALVAGVLIWMEDDSQAEFRDELEAQVARRDRNSSAKKETEDAYRANAKALSDWAERAHGFVSEQGVRSTDTSQDPAAFKQQMVEDARAFSKLPEESSSKIVKEDFDFGYRQYIGKEGAEIPKREDLPRLQREWYDIVRFTDILVKCGAAELVGVKIAEKAAPEPQGARGGRRPAQQQKDPSAAYPSTESTYVFTFLARPAALVRVLNALAADDRFFAVDAMTFEQASDPLVQMLGGDKEKEQGRRGGRRRRRGAEAEEPAPEADGDAAEIARKGLVTDPATCTPFTVNMTVSTLEFAAREEEK